MKSKSSEKAKVVAALSVTVLSIKPWFRNLR